MSDDNTDNSKSTRKFYTVVCFRCEIKTGRFVATGRNTKRSGFWREQMCLKCFAHALRDAIGSESWEKQ